MKDGCCMVSANIVHIDPIHTKTEENHQSKENKAVECLEKENEDIVNEDSNDVSNHLLVLLMERRPANARWTIYPQELNLQPKKSFLRNVANGVGGYPKWNDVDIVS
ncbi:unnamed protein product [Lactuca saligna]|uniref:Uncharacterized protein n=1 Tax=Lactuca saligna TaxID=75948 RepID=A0AA35ZHS6_LACSI|nr:unnamed protein product [Lactuca saligna]